MASRGIAIHSPNGGECKIILRIQYIRSEGEENTDVEAAYENTGARSFGGLDLTRAEIGRLSLESI
jgi:hypothetical protein